MDGPVAVDIQPDPAGYNVAAICGQGYGEGAINIASRGGEPQGHRAAVKRGCERDETTKITRAQMAERQAYVGRFSAYASIPVLAIGQRFYKINNWLCQRDEIARTSPTALLTFLSLTCATLFLTSFRVTLWLLS